MTDIQTIAVPTATDDPATAHLPGVPLPSVRLMSTTGAVVDLGALPGRVVLFVYPMTPRPGAELPPHWDEIPGARGCTAQAAGFNDAHEDLVAAGATTVLGLSSQTSQDQDEAAARLRLTYSLVADPGLELHRILRLPTFEVAGRTLYRRLTLVLVNGVVEHVFYPVYPPEQHAGQVLTWLLTTTPQVPVTTGPVPVVPAHLAAGPPAVPETLGARMRRAG